jgi:Transposase DDE domain
MPPIRPISRQFDQPTLCKLIDADPVVQRYRVQFALFDWSAIDPPRQRGPGSAAHPTSA